MVLAEVQEMGGPQARDEVFPRIAGRHAETMEPQLDGLDFDEKLHRILGWLNQAGTLAAAEETSEGVRVAIHNCPFRNTALKDPAVCTITPHLMNRLLGAQVNQASAIHRSGPDCSFF